MQKKITKMLTLLLLIVSVSGCGSKSLEVSNEKRVILPNKIEFKENRKVTLLGDSEEKFYSDAKLAKIWVATYKTGTNVRVRSHFVDTWVKRADFKDIEFMPDFVNN